MFVVVLSAVTFFNKNNFLKGWLSVFRRMCDPGLVSENERKPVINIRYNLCILSTSPPKEIILTYVLILSPCPREKTTSSWGGGGIYIAEEYFCSVDFYVGKDHFETNSHFSKQRTSVICRV